MSGRTLLSTWGIAATDLLSLGDHFDVQKDEGICTDAPPCLTQLLCDKLLTFAKGSEDKCGNINRGTLMVYEENNVLRAGTVTHHFKIINFQSFSITFNHTCEHTQTQYSVQFSHSVVSDSLRPHELQHVRPPCPSPTPGVHPDPCPWNR